MLGLLRYQVFLVYGVVFLACWVGAKHSAQEPTLLVDFAPLWAVLALGVYAASTVAYNVLTFRDCPEASLELEKQIQEAKAEMKKRKIID